VVSATDNRGRNLTFLEYTAIFLRILPCTLYTNSVSPGFEKQIMPIFLQLQRQLSNLKDRKLTSAKFKPLMFSVWLRLFLRCRYVHSHDFV
jgi:hypothetical protein